MPHIDGTGPGSHLPYRVEWHSDARTSDVAGLMRTRLDDGTCRIVDSSDKDGTVRVRSARAGSGGAPPIIAEVAVSAVGTGSRVRLEFSPPPRAPCPATTAG